MLSSLLGACDGIWNSPYPPGQASEPIYYSSFAERPKHLDPVRSYSSNEAAFISQVYEPPLQYDFLKRPFELIPLSAETLPQVTHLDAKGEPLPQDVPAEQIAFTDYQVTIKPGILYQPHPAFARSEDGGYRYFPLQEGALDDRFALSDFDQSGTRELLADDFVYAVKRLAFAPNHSPLAGLMSEHIRGFQEFADRAAEQHEADQAAGVAWTDLRAIPMSGVEAIDRYTYRIRLSGSYPQFRYWLAMNFFAPMPWEAERFHAQAGMKERNLTLDWYPVGTGPFMLTENNPNLRMVLQRNPNFRGELYPSEGTPEQRAAGLLDDAGRPLPLIERAVYSLEKEAIPRWNKFLQGYYDASGIASDSFDQAVQIGEDGEPNLTEQMRERGIELDTAVETSIYYTGFNMLDPVVGGNPEDPEDMAKARKLRQAVSIAFDWEEYISIFLNGRGEVAPSPLPPGIFGYRTGEAGMNRVTHRWVNGRAERLPIERARELLREAGYPEGRDPSSGGPLILYYDTAQTGPGSKSMLQWYTKQLDKLGIELVVRATDYNRFQEKMLKGTAQMFSWGWNADYPDPENFYFLLFGPNGKVENRGENAANFSNSEFDVLFEDMKNLPNGAARQQVIDRMNDILREQAPWMFGFFPKSFSLHHDWYNNALPHQMANNTLKYKRIDAPRRAAEQAQWNRPVLWPIGLLLVLLVLSGIPAIRDYRARERSRAL